MTRIFLGLKFLIQDFFYLGSGGGDAGINFGYYTSTFRECRVFLGYSKKWEDL